jgi:hypothetical protein
MKPLSLIGTLLLCFGPFWAAQKGRAPYDIVLRDNGEPFAAAFQSASKDFSIMSCDEYGFGAAGAAKIETTDYATQITFDFKWRGDKDFSFHPRRQPGVTITIKAGDNLHGEFTVNTCGKTATGIIRDDNQNIILMSLSDTNITDSEGSCGGGL